MTTRRSTENGQSDTHTPWSPHLDSWDGGSLCLCAAVALGPGLTPARAAQTADIEVEIESICAALGDLAWAAYIAKDYKLLAEIDAAMEAIGCFD